MTRATLILPIVWATSFLPNTALGIITSDAIGTHVVQNSRAFGENLSGVANFGLRIDSQEFGITVTIPFCSAALITDHHLLTAAHCVDGVHELQDFLSLFPEDPPAKFSAEARFVTSSGDVRVRLDLDSPTFDPDWPEIDADLTVIQLLDAPPENAVRYPVYAGQQEVGKQVVVSGFGAIGHGSIGQELPDEDVELALRAGLNRIEDTTLDFSGQVEALLFDFDSSSPENNTIQLLGTASDLGFGIDEVGVGEGDSGGPVLHDGAIYGILVAQQNLPDLGDLTEETDGSWGELGVVLRTSSFVDFISESTDGEAVFVPEPAGCSSLLLWFAFVSWRRRSPRIRS